MRINWYEPGYPATHSSRWNTAGRVARNGLLIAQIVFIFALVGTMFGFIPALVTAAILVVPVVFAIVNFVCSLYDTSKYLHVIPYFETNVGKIGTFTKGYGIASRLKQLDSIATQQGVRTISSYGFKDDLLGETLVWHDPAEGIKTVRALIERLDNKQNLPKVVDDIVLDLMKWRFALERARARDIRFCLLLRHGNIASVHEWEVREGTVY